MLQLPGARTVCYASATPFEEPGSDEVRPPGEVKGRGRQASVDYVSANFFEALGVPIVRGRVFANSDVPAKGMAQVSVVSEAFARALWKGQDPIGKAVETSDDMLLLVVGVARDTMSEQFGALDLPRQYRLQAPQSFGGPLFVRFDGDPNVLAPSIQKTVRNLDAAQVAVPRTLRTKMDDAAAIIGRMAKMVVFRSKEDGRVTSSPNSDVRPVGTVGTLGT